MGSNSNVNLPNVTSGELLEDKFSNYFTRKATIIRNKIISDTPNITGDIFMEILMKIGSKGYDHLLRLRSRR